MLFVSCVVNPSAAVFPAWRQPAPRARREVEERGVTIMAGQMTTSYDSAPFSSTSCFPSPFLELLFLLVNGTVETDEVVQHNNSGGAQFLETSFLFIFRTFLKKKLGLRGSADFVNFSTAGHVAKKIPSFLIRFLLTLKTVIQSFSTLYSWRSLEARLRKRA